MTRVLVVVGKVRPHVLTDALTQLRTAGTRVAIVINDDAEDLKIDPRLAEVHYLPVKRADLPTRARLSAEIRRPWFKVRRDPWVRRHARVADVIVALDRQSIHAVWELAQRNRRPAAVYGLAPAIDVITADMATRQLSPLRVAAAMGGAALRDARDDARMLAKRLAVAAVSERAMRNRFVAAGWSAFVAAPGMPDRVRAKLAFRIHANMVIAGRVPPASRPLAAKITNDRTKAELMVRTAAVTAGYGDAASVAAAAEAMLSVADDAYANKQYRRAAADLYRTAGLLFHRGLHFDSRSSPLADDPDRYLAQWRASTAAQALWVPRERIGTAVPQPSDRPMRLLIATSSNANFLGEIRGRYEQMAGLEVRYINLSDDPQLRPARNDVAGMMEQLLGGRSPLGNKMAESLGPLLDWADTVFIDWCVAGAVLFTMVDPGTTRVIVRLHSFEAFSLWPHLVDFSRVDDVIFVSDHVRDLSNQVLPQLAEGPRQHVITNAMDLRRYVRTKDDDARFTLGLVGAGSIAKDPRWAIDVLRILRRHDNRYRLVFMGEDLATKGKTAARAYEQRLTEDFAELEPPGALVRLGHVSDVPKALAEVGVILSTSLRESFHCALVEGAASGAVPVVRNWPYFAAKEHGAHTIYPTEWIVDSPEEAAGRILQTTGSQHRWRAEGDDASAHALTTWDWSIISRDFDRLLLPGVSDITLSAAPV